MSLISAKNFAAPFEKRWQLIMMLLVTLLFALLRVTMSRSTGFSLPQSYTDSSYSAPASSYNASTYSAPIARAAPPPPPPQSNAAPQLHTAPAAQPANRAQPAAPNFESSRAEVMNDLFGGEEATEQKAAADAKPKQGGLDDIEAKLGLR